MAIRAGKEVEKAKRELTVKYLELLIEKIRNEKVTNVQITKVDDGVMFDWDKLKIKKNKHCKIIVDFN